MSKAIQNSKEFEIYSLDNKLKNLINEYKNDVAVKVYDSNIPLRILHKDMYHLYKLDLVTDKYVYYSYDDLMIVLDAKDHSLLTDVSGFSENAFYESLQNIDNGTETKFFGENFNEDF